jgi:hypothetical protein
LHAPIPFTAQDGAGPHIGDTPNRAHGLLSCFLRRLRTIKQALALGIQVTEPVRLQSVGQDAKKEMPGQVRARRSPYNALPTAAKFFDAEIA